MSSSVIHEPKHVVAIIGGAVAGSTAAETLADAGVLCIVFEQNDRPYGKIEDGLPRWHVKQRKMEYERINSRINRPNVFFVPRTSLGRDIDFKELLSQWGLSAVILANGAWRDRPLPVEGVDAYVEKGLVYQNPFIYWFNHKNEKVYAGTRYAVQPGTIVVGGGLASIDVVKVVQLELYEAALRNRGVEASMLELEHKGIPDVCKAHGVDAAELGVKDVALCYRRRDIDMPLAQIPAGAAPEKATQIQGVRKKMLSRIQDKYRVRFEGCRLPVSPMVEDGRLAGLRFVKTHVEGRSASPVPETEEDIRAPLVISSIGSIPELIHGVEMKRELYCFKDLETGEYEGAESVFGLGNVVTGQGNISVSRKHAAAISQQVIENYLGIGKGNRDISTAYRHVEGRVQQQVEHIRKSLGGKPPLEPAQVNAILARVRKRQEEIGYKNYADFIKAVTPPDLE